MMHHLQPLKSFLSHPPPLFYLLLSFLTTIFGAGFQNVPIFSWVQPFFLLAFLSLSSSSRAFLWWLLALLFQTVATTMAYAGILNDPSFVVLNVAIVFGISLVYNALIFFFVYFIYLRAHLRYAVLGGFVVIVFPTLYTGILHILNFTPFGDFFNVGYTQVDWKSLMQLVSLFGIGGVCFLVTLFSGVLHWYWSIYMIGNYSPIPRGKSSKNVAYFFTTLLVLSLVYGGLSISTYGGSFFQNSLTDTIPSHVTAACLIGQSDSSFLPDLLNRTWTLAANHDLVLWAETGALVTSATAESALLSNISEISATTRTYIGVTYLLQPNSPDPTKNMLVFFAQDGNIIFRYQKSHLVPIVEATVTPGPADLPVAYTPLGIIGGAICFDFNYPPFIGQAGSHGVDLMLQPSWTWGPIGKWHAQLNSIRAIEQGFHTFRCGSGGYSGVFAPNGEILSIQPFLKSGNMSTVIPMVHRRWTWYGVFGDVFSWACVVFSVLYWVAVAPEKLLRRLPQTLKDSETFQTIFPEKKEVL